MAESDLFFFLLSHLLPLSCKSGCYGLIDFVVYALVLKCCFFYYTHIFYNVFLSWYT